MALGIQRGDRVGIWAPNCVEWLLAQFGTARIGAILVNINPAYRTSELEYALNKVQCRVLIMAHSLKSGDYIAMFKELAPEFREAAIKQVMEGGRSMPSVARYWEYRRRHWRTGYIEHAGAQRY